MAAILRLEDEQVAALCVQAAAETGDVVQVANYNSPGQVVISGEHAGVAARIGAGNGGGGTSPTAGRQHRRALGADGGRGRDIRGARRGTPFRTPQPPIIGNITAQPLTTRRGDPSGVGGATHLAGAVDGFRPDDGDGARAVS